MFRKHAHSAVVASLKAFPVVAILGPRQCGKTTMARAIAKKHKKVHFFDLEDPVALAELADPKLRLESLEGLVVIDEIQRLPDLFPLLRVFSDRRPRKARFLILGSASRDLIRQSSETLAGRISYFELTPFTLDEVGVGEATKLWDRGGFPPSFLAKTAASSLEWRKQYISTFLERDIPALGINIPAPQLRRFWMMLAHYHGQIWNASELGASLGVADTTVKRYLDILSGTFMVRQLQPWFANVGKRQVKAPKIYIRDSGLLHSLLGIRSHQELMSHPKLGGSWEGFALETVLHGLAVDSSEAFFWAVHGQSEIDLYLPGHKGGVAYEFKHASAPTLTASMKAVMRDLRPKKLIVVYPGEKSYPLAEGIEVKPLLKVLEDLL